MPGAGLKVGDAAVQDDRPDRDAGVEVAVRERVADRAGVRPAPVALELGDELHRPDLRRAGDGAGREARAQEVERPDAVAQLADDLGDEMRDVREALRLHEPLDVHRARAADAREVVAAEVDEHHVLGAVLLRCEQPLGVAGAGLRRAGDRVQARARALGLDERLRRGADQGQVAELEQEEVGRRVDAAERPVELERARGGRALGALGEDDLEGVAGADVLLRAPTTERSYSARPGWRRGRATLARAARQRGVRARRAARAARRVAGQSTWASPAAWSKRTSVSATTNRLSG